MKKIIVFATLLVLQVIAGNVTCDDSQSECISEFGRTRRATPPVYNPEGKINPFEPIYSNEPTKHAPTVHQTDCISNPVLEGMDMSQLKLTGIIITERQPMALVQEADGKGHILKENVCYGRHGGKIERILNDRIIVREEMLGSTGQIQIKMTELKLKRNIN
jgi:type IV pilus assembly protein PilP